MIIPVILAILVPILGFFGLGEAGLFGGITIDIVIFSITVNTIK